MSQPHTDRNLLFGIMAVQMDFIGRDNLIAAMNAWVLDKTRLLGQILVEQGSLRPDKHELLEALVRAHLEMHDNDPEKSLAALSPVPSVRQELQQIADPDLQSSLAHVSCPRVAPDSGATGPYVPAASSSSGLRYRILRPHARGGLGEVSVAYDAELDREVALKEIQERHAGQPANLSRFLLEAKVTGGLEHPGIVPVYGLGTYADGRPFYTMRFVRGDNLKDAIERFHKEKDRLQPGDRTLRLRQLLGRFLDVCNAIEYAHSRGVLHRDLKPGNILVGKYGETLVVDWGLAKVLDQAEAENTEGLLPNPLGGDSGLTQAGTTLGTPAYMSPEQAAGRPNEMGSRSDVYGLGATLYCLLTGRAPFTDGDRAEVQRKVQRGDFPRPRALERGVARPLEAVCLKAMALKKEDRYAAPHELAADLERWLADEPVSCYREPWAVRLARWGRKYRTAVAGVVALLLTAVVALSVTTVLIRLEQKRTEDAREEEARQRARAQENFRKARQAVDDYLTAVSENRLLQSPLPGLQPLRKELLAGALKYYQEFVEQHQDNPTLRSELARAHYRVGKINDEMGATADALHSCEQALGLWRGLVAEDPADSGYRFEEAQVLSAMGARQIHLPGQRDKGLTALNEARPLLEGLVREQPANSDFRAALAKCYSRLSVAIPPNALTATTPEEVDLHQKALTIYQELARTDPKYRIDVASAAMTLGHCYTRLRKSIPAMSYHRQSLALLEELSREKPPEFWLRRETSRAYLNIGYVQSFVRGQHVEALKNYDQCRLIVDQLARDNPSVLELQQRQAELYRHCAEAQLALGQPQKALDMAAQSAEIQKKDLFEGDPALKWETLAETYLALGEAQSRLQRQRESLDAYQAAYAAWVQYGQIKSPRHRRIRWTFSRLISLQYRAGGPDRVIRTWETAVRMYDNAARAGRDSRPDDLKDLAWACGGLGDACREAGKKAEAASAYEHVIQVWEKELHRDTSGDETVGTVFRAGLELAQLRLADGRHAEAKGLAVLARDLLVTGTASYPVNIHRARLDALSASLAGAGKPELTDEEKAECLRYGEAAVEALRRAGPEMYQAAEKIRNDPVLQPLHAREDFRQLLAELEEKGRFDKEWPQRIKQARERVGQGDHAAAAAAGSLAGSRHASAHHWSDSADVYSDCVKAALHDNALPPAERDKVARGYADEGTRLLLRFREFVQANKGYFARRVELARANARLAALAGSAGGGLTEKEKADRQRYADEAVAELRRHLDEGGPFLTHLKSNKVWDPLRERADFRELETEFETGEAERARELRGFQKAEELAWEDKHAEAAAEVAGLIESKYAQPRTFFQAARIYSLCAAAARRDEKLGSIEQDQFARQYSDRAVGLIRQAVAKGLRAGEGNMESEVDFIPIRKREDFQELLAEWKKKNPKVARPQFGFY
jgi:serine/threonine-protein kinase